MVEESCVQTTQGMQWSLQTLGPRAPPTLKVPEIRYFMFQLDQWIHTHHVHSSKRLPDGMKKQGNDVGHGNICAGMGSFANTQLPFRNFTEHITH